MTPGRSFRDWWTRAFQTRTALTQPVTGVWYLNLDKADAGYTLFLHNMSEAGVGTTFAGITSPNLSSTESKDILFDYIVRLRHLGRRWDYFAESDMNFEYNAQRVKLAPNDEPYQASQKANYWFQQTGAALRLKPASRNPWGFKLMLPAAMQTQVAPPFTIFTLSDNQIYTAKTTRSYYVSARPGLRYEGPKSWIESGLPDRQHFPPAERVRFHQPPRPDGRNVPGTG